MELGLSNKVALVTGSNRGTGQIIARRLSEEGAFVMVHSLNEGESSSVAAELPNAVALLASERAAFINGQNVRIDGGAVDIV